MTTKVTTSWVLEAAKKQDTENLWVLDEAFAKRISRDQSRRLGRGQLNMELATTLPDHLRRHGYQDTHGNRHWAYCCNPSMFTGRPSRSRSCDCLSRGDRHAFDCPLWEWPSTPHWHVLTQDGAAAGFTRKEKGVSEEPPPTRKRPAKATP